MNFYSELTEATRAQREALLASPIIVDTLAGRVSRDSYVAFLTEAYHHVKHTVPLLMACGSRLPARHAWLQPALVEYIREEAGHEQWILNDLEACGSDSARAIEQGPRLPTELMVSFVYDQIQRVNPLAFFGMVYVLEGTSVTIATLAAERLRAQLGLPRQALSYLLSHGSVDQKHIGDFERIVNRIQDPGDRAAIVHCARVVFALYGEMFRALPRATDRAAPATALDSCGPQSTRIASTTREVA